MLSNTLDNTNDRNISLNHSIDCMVQEARVDDDIHPDQGMREGSLIINNEQLGQPDRIEPLEANLDVPIIRSSAYKWRRSFYRGFTIAAVLLNPLFAIFLYAAIAKAIDESRAQLKLENEFWGIFFTILNVIMSSLSGLSDIIVVNPIEETEELLKALGNNQLTERLKSLSSCERKSIKGFNYFNQTIGNSVFFVGSASAALSVTYLSTSTQLRWGLGVPVIILSHAYLNMLSRAKIDEHSYQFIHRFASKNNSMLINILNSPPSSLEVLIQVFVNALNRGITYGYIMEQILKEYFNQNSTSSNAVTPLISYATASSFYTFLFSRTLNVHKQFFNPQFTELSAELLKNTKVSRLGTVIDISMTVLRAGAASALLFRHGPKLLPLNIFLTVSLGIFLTSHGLYVRYKNRLYQTALDIKVEQTVRNRRIDGQQTVRELSSEEMFDFIKEQFKVQHSIKISATIINGGSRLADWFSFLGFLITMNKLIGPNNIINFDFYDLLCIQQLLCNPALENALSFFQEGMVDTLAYYRTKVHLEWKERHFGCGNLIKAKVDYPKTYLKKFLPIQEAGRGLEQFLPRGQSSAQMQPSYQAEGAARPLATQFELQKAKINTGLEMSQHSNNSNEDGSLPRNDDSVSRLVLI